MNCVAIATVGVPDGKGGVRYVKPGEPVIGLSKQDMDDLIGIRAIKCEKEEAPARKSKPHVEKPTETEE